MKKKDGLLIGIILLLALLAWFAVQLFLPQSGDLLKITVDGEVYGHYYLSQDQIIEVQKGNVCRIEDGEVTMIMADCPDQLCIHQQTISSTKAGTIVCLPNRVVLEIISSRELPGPDAMTS